MLVLNWLHLLELLQSSVLLFLFHHELHNPLFLMAPPSLCAIEITGGLGCFILQNIIYPSSQIHRIWAGWSWKKGVEIVVTLYGSTCIFYFVSDKSFPPANLLFFMDEWNSIRSWNNPITVFNNFNFNFSRIGSYHKRKMIMQVN